MDLEIYTKSVFLSYILRLFSLMIYDIVPLFADKRVNGLTSGMCRGTPGGGAGAARGGGLCLQRKCGEFI